MCAGLGCIYTDYFGGCGYRERGPKPCTEEYEEYEDYLANKADDEYDRIQEEKGWQEFLASRETE